MRIKKIVLIFVFIMIVGVLFITIKIGLNYYSINQKLEKGINIYFFTQQDKVLILDLFDLPKNDEIEIEKLYYKGSFKDPYAVVYITAPSYYIDNNKSLLLNSYEIDINSISLIGLSFLKNININNFSHQYININFKSKQIRAFEFNESTEYIYVFYASKLIEGLPGYITNQIKIQNYS